MIQTKMQLISFAQADDLAAAAAAAWLDEIEAASRAGKLHCVALSGGRITQKFFTATVAQAKARGIGFENCHFFWADERCLPPTDPDSNFKLANDLLFSKLGNISEKQIHRLRGEDSPSAAVKIADSEVCRIAPQNQHGQPVLDLVLLGMGEDSHVASLFPNAGPNILNCATTFLAVDNSPKPPPTRISLSYAAIAAARQVWVLVSGTGKAEAWRATLQPDGTTPLARVIRSRSATKIFSDLAEI
jgi:6-phosphogluconolactonase